MTNRTKNDILYFGGTHRAAGCRGVAQLVARLLWEQEAASSSLATPIEEKATMNRLEMRFCRGFICYSYYKIRLECALFVPCCSQNAFSEHFDRPPKKKKRPAESDRSGRS